MIYIASPFFNESQLEFVKRIEIALQDAGIKFFSPRSEGVLIEMSPSKKAKAAKKIYDSNVKHIEDCDILLAVIDDRDTGTMFEIGYAAALKKPVVTLTNFDYQVNVMIKQCSYAHLKGLEHLSYIINFIREGREAPVEFSNTNQDVT